MLNMNVQWSLVIIINIIILSHPLFSWQIYFFPLILLQTGFLCFSSTWWRMVTLQLGTYTIQFMKPAESGLASPSLSHKFPRGKIWLVQFMSGTLLWSNSPWLREAIVASTHGHRILVFWKTRGGSHNRSRGMEQTLNGLPQCPMVKNPPAMQEPQVQSLGQEDPLEKGMAIHSSILGGFHGQRSLAGYSS